MKLYATTTSERATKGQGGEYLDINIQDDRQVTFATIQVRKEKGLFMPTLYVQTIGKLVQGETKGKMNIVVEQHSGETKGKRQKGEKLYTQKQNNCEHLYRDASDKNYCVDCGKKF